MLCQVYQVLLSPSQWWCYTIYHLIALAIYIIPPSSEEQQMFGNWDQPETGAGAGPWPSVYIKPTLVPFKGREMEEEGERKQKRKDAARNTSFPEGATHLEVFQRSEQVWHKMQSSPNPRRHFKILSEVSAEVIADNVRSFFFHEADGLKYLLVPAEAAHTHILLCASFD